MQDTILSNTGALGAFSACPQSTGNRLRVTGGKIVERTTKKPHLVAVPDATAEGGVKMEPMQNLFDFL